MIKHPFSIKVLALGFIAGIINGLFGAGGGTLLVPGMFFLLGISQHKAHATAIAVILPLTLVSTYIYVQHGIIAWEVTWRVILGGVIGSFIGARLFSKLSDNLLRKAFGLFMIAAAIRLVI
ncbi:MAG: sulfite exporter TauE/SafE family protein [Thermotaleaceae bacterium]